MKQTNPYVVAFLYGACFICFILIGIQEIVNGSIIDGIIYTMLGVVLLIIAIIGYTTVIIRERREKEEED